MYPVILRLLELEALQAGEGGHPGDDREAPPRPPAPPDHRWDCHWGMHNTPMGPQNQNLNEMNFYYILLYR